LKNVAINSEKKTKIIWFLLKGENADVSEW